MNIRWFGIGFAAIGWTITAVLAAYASGKLYYGSRVGMQVTVISISGLDSANAVIRTKHTRSDAITFCREYVGKVTEKCIRDELAIQLNDIITANCSTGVFTDFYGSKYQFRGKHSNKDTFGPKYVLINLGTQEIADGSSASGYPTNMQIYRALCPKIAPSDP